MNHSLVYKALLTGLSLLVMAGSVQSGTVDLSGTVGYEFISQEFFLDSLISTGADQLEAVTSLKTTYLDDIKSSINLRYRPRDDRRIEFRARYEQTPEFIRGKFYADFRPRTTNSRFDLNYQLDIRQRYGGVEESGDNYLYGRGRGKWTQKISGKSSGWLDLSLDFVDFDSTSDLSYDQFLFRARTGLLINFENFSMLNIGPFYRGRRVPDSSALGYNGFGLAGSFLGFLGRHELDIAGRLERRDYLQRGSEDDYWRIEMDGRGRLRLGEHLFLGQQSDFELNFYDSTDLITYDYSLLRERFSVGYQGASATFAVGVELEWQNDFSEDSLLISDDYSEIGFVAQFDFMDIKRLFLTSESIYGSRKVANESEFQSDFRFERINLIADLKLVGHLSLNLLLSGEWEWHANEQENNQIILLNTSLTYKL